MSDALKHILGNWSIVAATITALGLLVAVVKYKIPDLAKKVAAMELSNKDQPSRADLTITLEGFKNQCHLNQAVCQKAVNMQMAAARKDIDIKLDALTQLVNLQAIVIARVDERIAALYRNHDHTFVPPGNVLIDE